MSKTQDRNTLADEERDAKPALPASSRGGNPPGAVTASASPGEGGFFTIYKSGQGYWTRLLTFLGFLLLGALTAHFIYSQTKGWIGQGTALGIAVGLFAVWLLVEYLLVNKASNADFLIATDSEMKKVNWTSRKELIGSTKVVIFFMFLTTAVLFLYDLVFHTIFWAMTILKLPPPFIQQ